MQCNSAAVLLRGVFSGILQGMLNATSDVVATTAVLMSLWKHECFRVIADRFTTQADKDWFEKTIQQVKIIVLFLFLFTYRT